jgi:hypothetical protein
MMDFQYTRHQVARGSRPDAVDGRTWYLFKKTSKLRLTYQIRLLTFMAIEERARLVIRLPASSDISDDLRRFVNDNRRTVKVERVS